MSKNHSTNENRLEELSRIANLAHKYGALEVTYKIELGATNLSKLKVDFKENEREQSSLQDKLNLSYGL